MEGRMYPITGLERGGRYPILVGHKGRKEKRGKGISHQSECEVKERRGGVSYKRDGRGRDFWEGVILYGKPEMAE